MDLKKYNNLRNKLKTRDFEGKNKGLDSWLYKFSFIGNIGSIFFAFFLIYPALYKTISLHWTENNLTKIISVLLSIMILSIFEIVKRYLIRNFSSDFVENNRKLKPSIVGWFIITILLISLSFYFSVTGSKNLATTSVIQNNEVKDDFKFQKDSLIKIFDIKKELFLKRNVKLETKNDSLMKKKSNIPDNYYSRKISIQKIIDRNEIEIESNLKKYNDIDLDLKNEISKLETNTELLKTNNSNDDNQNILLFVIIVIFIETLIITGIYFREYFEYNLYLINQNSYEKLYVKKERYKTLINFIYNNGKYELNDRVMAVMKLKELIKTKTKIQSSDKFVDEFINDMDKSGIFIVNGKKRYINLSYQEALNIIDNFDDTLQLLENMK